MKFSIIIPVYKVEKYIDQCLESLLNQRFNDYEVILIDDGSKDNSGKICDDYVSKYMNFNVIHQTNEGLSSARNKGIENAKGDYLIFIDSDDYIAANSLTQIDIELKKSHFPDLLITQHKAFDDTGVIAYYDQYLQKHDISKINKEMTVRLFFNHSESIWSAWRYIVKRKFIKENQIKFPDGYLHEDIEWTIRIFLFAHTFGNLKADWYYYRIDNKHSIMNNMQFENYLDIFTLITTNIQYIEKNCDNDPISVILTQRLSTEFFDWLFFKYNALAKAHQREIVEIFKTNKTCFKFKNRIKHNIFFILARFFGLDFSLRLHKMLQKLKRKSKNRS